MAAEPRKKSLLWKTTLSEYWDKKAEKRRQSIGKKMAEYVRDLIVADINKGE